MKKVTISVPKPGTFDGQLLQQQILDQLERVNRRLDQVEDRMAGPATGTQKLSKNIVTSAVKKDKVKKVLPVVSDSSSDESEVPSVMCRILRRFQHCTGHITTGSWKGRGNQYI